VKVVAAALGDDVEDSAGRLAIFRPESAGLDFNLLDELEWEIRSRSAKCGVARGNAVQNIVILGTRGPCDRRIAVATRLIARPDLETVGAIVYRDWTVRCVGKFENCADETLVPVVLLVASMVSPAVAVMVTCSEEPCGLS
jgi:hypothetical protein